MADMEKMNSEKQGQSKDLSQEYGLFDPKNKTEGADIELDHQQRYDNSIQESEISPNRPDLEEDPSEDKNFTRNFYKYSKNYQDNENGAPGVDEDYGIYTAPEEPKVEVDVEEVSSEDVLAGSDWMEDRPDKTDRKL